MGRRPGLGRRRPDARHPRVAGSWSADKARLAGYLKELIDGCLAHQCPSGLFHNVVDDPASFEETDLAQMLAYSTTKARAAVGCRAITCGRRPDALGRAGQGGRGWICPGRLRPPNFSRPGISAEGQAFFLISK